MNSIYFWLFLLARCFLTVQGSSGVIPRRNSNEVYYREQQQQKLSAAKYVDGKYPNAYWNSSRRLSGRHVCTQSKVVMVPMKDTQSYCKPVYQSYLRRCDRNSSGYCTGYRAVYELAYRIVQTYIPKTESLQTCCPGWTQMQISANDCKRAICREKCRNGGMCLKPDQCTCLPGWTGKVCETAVCRESCKNGGICTRPDQCTCPQGWIGKTCETDVDECSWRRHSCEHECVNVPGSYKCLCREDYALQGDRRSCKKIEVKKYEDNTELIKKIETLQQRLMALEEWQRKINTDGMDSRHRREDRINSLSEQMAIIEETLEEWGKICEGQGSCYRRSSLSFPPPQR